MLASLEQQLLAPKVYWISISHWGMIQVTFYEWLKYGQSDLIDFLRA